MLLINKNPSSGGTTREDGPVRFHDASELRIWVPVRIVSWMVYGGSAPACGASGSAPYSHTDIDRVISKESLFLTIKYSTHVIIAKDPKTIAYGITGSIYRKSGYVIQWSNTK